MTALAILGRLAERCSKQFGPPQHTIVQRLLRSLRRKATETIIARMWHRPGSPGPGTTQRVMGSPRRPQSLRSTDH
jgi:hypothetical protein